MVLSALCSLWVPQQAWAQSSSRAPVELSIAADSERADLTLHLNEGVNPILGPGDRDDASRFRTLCTLPCSVSLRKGAHAFGVSAGEGPLIEVEPMLTLRPAAHADHVVVRYDERRGLRAFGWVVFAASAGLSLAMVTVGASDGFVDTGRAVIGALVPALGIVAGLWLAHLPDRATAWLAH
jgi:hypothetical protein